MPIALKKPQGFTIIELLIVIVIIAILAAITIVAYNGITDRAKAAQIESMYTQANKAFHLLGVDQGWTTWPLDNAFTGTANPSLQQVITATNLKNYMQTVSIPSGTTVGYDNDGDTNSGCAANTSGVDLFMVVVSVAVAQRIDSDIDDGNLSCGKVVYISSLSELVLFLSFDQAFN